MVMHKCNKLHDNFTTIIGTQFLQVILYNNRIPHVSTKKSHCNNQFRHDQHDICWLASVSYLAMGRNRA